MSRLSFTRLAGPPANPALPAGDLGHHSSTHPRALPSGVEHDTQAPDSSKLMMRSFSGTFARFTLLPAAASRSSRAGAVVAALTVSLSIGLSGCGQGTPPLVLSGASVGDLVDQPPSSTVQSKHFVVDPSAGGLGGTLNIERMFWGRLVDVTDADGVLQQKDYVVGEVIQSDSHDFKVTTNPVTSITTVQILHPYLDPAPPGEPPGGTDYNEAFQRLELDLVTVVPKGATPADLPPFSMAPRNSALVIQFSDLLKESTISTSNLRVLTGSPPSQPFETRVLRDQNHGDLADFDGNGVLEFHSTRVIIATTVSDQEALASNPPLPINAIGLPVSFTANLPNVLVRIPTQTDPFTGQSSVLTNLSGRPLDFANNAPNDSTSDTSDVVRALRSGNSTDAHNGFLLDLEPPYVVGVQQAGLNAPGVGDGLPNDGTNFRLVFVTPACMSSSSPLKVGDVLHQPLAGVYAQISSLATPSDTQNVIIAGPGAVGDPKYLYKIVLASAQGAQSLAFGPCELATIYDPATDGGNHKCFVRFSNVAQPPATRVGTQSTVSVRFSKPMDPASLKPFDTQTITRVSGTATPYQYVVGQVNPSSNITEFTFQPTLPFAHTLNQQENYFFNLGSGATGPTDLAGLPLAIALPQVQFSIDPQAVSQSNSGVALRFNSLSELDPAGLLHDIRGQFLIDQANGILRPRAVTRFSVAADRTQAVPSIMPIFAAGEQTPLSGLGSKLQQIWRYCDVGFGLLDETQTNVDVENIDWTPRIGAVIGDHYSRFEIGLCHSFFLPDETPRCPPLQNQLFWPQSGLVTNFSTNYLDPTNDPLKIVHNRNLGYNVNPSDLFASEHGVPMVPYPLNRTIPVDQYKYYTWRDTSIQTRAAPNGPGTELYITKSVAGTPCANLGDLPPTYASGSVPTVGLPLLMEFRCFPDNTSLGLNSFDTSIAVTISTRPNFRAFSTGGTQGSGPVIKDPDLQPVATGGFNPNSTPPGAATPGVDNTFYIGQLDLVLRVSRAHTMWINTPSSSSPVYSTPVIEPRSDDQPLGTELLLSFRGANSVQGGAAATNAAVLDYYGNPDSTGETTGIPDGSVITFLAGDSSWKSSMSQIQGAKLFQVRVSFVSNTQTQLVPILSALGFAYKL